MPIDWKEIKWLKYKLKIKWEMFVLFSTQFLETVLARFKIGQVAIYGMAYIASLDHWAE